MPIYNKIKKQSFKQHIGFSAGILALATAIIISSPAAANNVSNPSDDEQVTTPNTKATNNEAINNEERDVIYITAQKRKQKAQDVPISLSVVDGKSLAEKNIVNVNDLENAVPSLEVDSAYGGGQPQFRIRGIGNRDYSAGNSTTVGIYYDEVAYPYGSSTQGALFDIERIEVLRGPQGTLFGRNTTGGAINITTNGPTDYFSYGGNISYGNNQSFNADGFISGPLTENLKGRLAIVRQDGGAWQKNRDTGAELGDKDIWGARAKLEYNPTEQLKLLLTSNYVRDKSDGLGLVLTAPFQSRSAYTPLGKLYPIDTQHDITGWGLSNELAAIIGIDPTNAKPFRDNEGWDTSLNAQYDNDDVKFTSISSIQRFSRGEYNDWDATSSREADTYFHNKSQIISQEFRIESSQESDFNWLAGIYGTTEYIKGGFYSDFSDAYRPGFLTDTRYGQKVRSIGLFGQFDKKLTDKLNLNFGLRYEDETRKLEDFYTWLSTATAPTSPPHSTSTSLNAVTGKIGVDYRVSPDILTYAFVARGVKSGGFTTYNKGSVSNDQLIPFKPEYVWSYETGFKSDLFGRKLQLNGALFYNDYRDQQVQASIVSELYGPIGKLVNAPKSHIYGFELEGAYKPTRNLTITQAIGYKIGEYDDFESVDNTATRAARDPITRLYSTVVYRDRSGERLPFPRFNYSGSINYKFNVDNFIIKPSFNYNYRSDLYSTATASIIEGYWLANASVGLTKQDAKWEIGLWSYNIFDKYYEESRNQFTNAATASPHGPRTYGISFSYKY